MGVIISLLVLPIRSANKRRQRQKDERIADNYYYSSSSNNANANAHSALPPRRSSPPGVSAAEPPIELQTLPAPAAAPALEAERALQPALATRQPPVGDSNKAPLEAEGRVEKDSRGEKGNMASDEDYMSFLERANADPAAGIATGKKQSGKVDLKTVDDGVEVPPVLKEGTEGGEWVYVSDADEEFVPVALRLGKGKVVGGLPDEATFAKLIEHPDVSGKTIEILDPVTWDSAGNYKDVVEATRAACKGGDVRVYRVGLGGTRWEYWLLGADKEKGSLVGVKALAIES